MDTLNDYDLIEVFKHLPIMDKVRLQSVSQTFKQLLEHSLRTQSHVGSRDNSGCPVHSRPASYKIPQKVSVDPTKLEALLRKMPNLRVVSLMLFHDCLPFQDNHLTCFSAIKLIASLCQKVTRVTFLYRYPTVSGSETLASVVDQLNSSYALLVTNCRNLRHLSLPFLSDNGLNHILKQMDTSKLESLNAYEFVGRGKSFSQLPPSLKFFATDHLFTLDSIEHLIRGLSTTSTTTLALQTECAGVLRRICERMTSLRGLNVTLSLPAVNLSELSSLERLTNLAKLTVDITGRTAPFVASSHSTLWNKILKEHSKLNMLEINGFLLDDEYFASLHLCSNLEVISLAGAVAQGNMHDKDPQLSDYFLAKVAQLQNLRSVDIRANNSFTASGALMVLKGCPNVESLAFNRCQHGRHIVTADVEVALLKQAKNKLRHFEVKGIYGYIKNYECNFNANGNLIEDDSSINDLNSI